MLSENKIWEGLRQVEDPELQVGIVDLGIVDKVTVGSDGRTRVKLVPTFVGCPALEIIRNRTLERLEELGVENAQVIWSFDEAWNPSRISRAGREQLAEFGIAAGDAFTARAAPEGAECPYCNSSDTERTTGFGPTICRAVYYCRSCGHSFEGVKNPGACASMHSGGAHQLVEGDTRWLKSIGRIEGDPRREALREGARAGGKR